MRHTMTEGFFHQSFYQTFFENSKDFTVGATRTFLSFRNIEVLSLKKYPNHVTP